MRNERPSFMRSAIAAAISSSFICTTAFTNELELTARVWDSKGSQPLPESVMYKYTPTPAPDGNHFAQHVTQSDRNYEKNQPYLRALDQLEHTGMGVVVTTINSDDGSHAQRFTVRIQKGGVDAFTMHHELASGQTTISVHPALTDTTMKGLLNARLVDNNVMESDTGVVTPDATNRILRKLSASEALEDFGGNDILAQETGTPAPQTPPFINKMVPGTAVPDSATMVDVDGAIAAIMTAYVETQLPDRVVPHPSWNGDTDAGGLPRPLQLILQKQPGYQVGARDIAMLADIDHAPVFLITQADPASQVIIHHIPRLAMATAHLERHRGSALLEAYDPIWLSKDSAKSLRKRAYDAQLDQLIRMKARHRRDGTLPTDTDMQKLASDQELILLCDAKLGHLDTTPREIVITAEEQLHMATKVDRRSLPVHIKNQFMNHPVVGEFVVSVEFDQAIDAHLPEKVPVPAPSEDLEYLDRYHDIEFEHKQQTLSMSSKARHNPIDFEEKIRRSTEAGDTETAEQVVTRLLQESDTETPGGARAREKLAKVDQILTETEADLGPDFEPDPVTNDTPAKRLRNIQQFKTDEKQTLRRQSEATTYIRAHSQQLVHPDILMVEHILTAEEFQAMKALELPVHMHPGEMLSRFQTLEPVVVYFEGVPGGKTLADFADELQQIQRTFFRLPRRNGVLTLIPEQTENFKQHMQNTYGITDTTEIVAVITQFTPDDVVPFGQYVQHIRQIHTTTGGDELLPRLLPQHIISLQEPELDYETLQQMHLHYSHATDIYEATWHQYELEQAYDWLHQISVVPTVPELSSFPDSGQLPAPSRLAALKDIAAYAPAFTALELANYMQAVGVVMNHLTTPDQTNQLEVLISKPFPAGNPEVHFRNIAQSMGIPEDSWGQIYELARKPHGLWKHSVSVIETNGGVTEVMPHYVTERDMNLAISPFDSAIVIQTRNLRRLNAAAHDARVAVQTQRQAEIGVKLRRLEQTVTGDEVYTTEHLRHYPDDADLMDSSWIAPVRAFLGKFGANPDRTIIVRYSQILSQFTNYEHQRLINILDQVTPYFHPNGSMMPGTQAAIEQQLDAGELRGKSGLVREYISLVGTEHSKNNLVILQEASASLRQHRQALFLTPQHIAVAMGEVDPAEIMRQRQIAHQNPDYYDLFAEAPAARTWLSKHPHLVIEPEAVMTRPTHHAMRRFVQLVIQPGSQGNARDQQAKLNAVNQMLRLSHSFDGSPLQQLAAEITNPGFSADELVSPDGTIIDQVKLATVATNLGITNEDDHVIVVNLLKSYRQPGDIEGAASEVQKLIAAGISPGEITPQRLTLINHPHVEEVDHALTLASSANSPAVRREYIQALHAKAMDKFSIEHDEYEQTIAFARQYKDRGDYTPEKFAHQKVLRNTLETIQEDLGATNVPEFDQPPQDPTPRHDQLRQKHADLTRKHNLRDTKQELESWDEEPLVLATDHLYEPLRQLAEVQLPPDMPDREELTETLALAKQHQAQGRLEEKRQLQRLLEEGDAQIFVDEFETYQRNNGRDMTVDAKIHRDLLTMKGWVDSDEEWTPQQVTKVMEVARPWYQDKGSVSSKAFQKYIEGKNRGVFEVLEGAVETSLQVTTPSAVKASMKQLFAKELVQEAINVGKVRHGLRQMHEDLHPVVDRLPKPDIQGRTVLTGVRLQLNRLKRHFAQLDGASEIEGATEIQRELQDLNDETPAGAILAKARVITGQEHRKIHPALPLMQEDDDGPNTMEDSPVGKAWKKVDAVVTLTTTVRDQINVVDGDNGLQGRDDSDDYDPEYVRKHQATIDEFQRDCATCTARTAWKSTIRKPFTDLVDEQGYPREDQLNEVETMATEGVQNTRIAFRTTVTTAPPQQEPAPPQQRPEDLDTINALQQRIRELETAVPAPPLPHHEEPPLTPIDEEAEADAPLPAPNEAEAPLPTPDGEYTRTYLDMELASDESLVLGELLRLAKARVPLGAIEMLDFQNPASVTMLTAMAASKGGISEGELNAMTARLVQHHKHVPAMLEKLYSIDAVPNDFHKTKLKQVLEDGSKTADTSTPAPELLRSKANKRVKVFYRVAVPLKDAAAKRPAVVGELKTALHFYARDDRADLTRRAATQDALDEIGIEKAQCDELLHTYTHNRGLLAFGLNKAEIIDLLVGDLMDAPYEYYDSVSLRVGKLNRHTRAMASRSAARISAHLPGFNRAWLAGTPYHSYVWVKDTGYSVAVSSSYTLAHLFLVYLRNRANLYLDDIAYYDGEHLKANILDVAAAGDEFMLNAGLVPDDDGDPQQQVISDTMVMFGQEAVRIYDTHFRAALGERADFMDNIVKPAALLVQSPIGFAEIGTVMKAGKGQGIWTWSNAWHTFGYTAIGIIADMTRGNQYNKQMIQAFDPAMKNFATWMDGKTHLYSDQASPEDKYYSDMWASFSQHWDGWSDYLGQTTVTKMGRPFAELAQKWITTKIYGSAFAPLLNPKRFALHNPAAVAHNTLVAQWKAPMPPMDRTLKPVVPLWQPGFGSVVLYQAAKEVFYDWAYNDLAGLKYGLEGYAEAADWSNGIPATSKESTTQWVKNDLHKYSLSHEETHFAKGRAYESWTFATDVVKGVSEAGARVGQMTGLDQLSGFSQGTYDEHGKPDFAEQARRPNTVSSWTKTFSDGAAWLMKNTGASNLLLSTYENGLKPGYQVTTGIASTAAEGLSTAQQKWHDVESYVYEAMGYELEKLPCTTTTSTDEQMLTEQEQEALKLREKTEEEKAIDDSGKEEEEVDFGSDEDDKVDGEGTDYGDEEDEENEEEVVQKPVVKPVDKKATRPTGRRGRGRSAATTDDTQSQETAATADTARPKPQRGRRVRK